METHTTDRLLILIADETGFPREQLTLATKIEDLGIDSLEFVDLVQTIGEKFKQIADEEFSKLETVGDILKAVA